jgi:hypothetical protein
MSQEHEIGDTIGGRQNFLGVRNRLPVETIREIAVDGTVD